MHRLFIKFQFFNIGGIMPYKIKLPSLLILIFLSFFVYAGFAGAQETGSVGSGAVDKEAAEKLSRMTPDEVKALDKKLADALTLYYDREFARALPIFQEIASKAETMDIMFWIGTSAMKTGENELAVAKFKKMLSADPKLHRVRLELAATYFSMGRYDEAKKELEIVKAASPPKAVLDNMAKLTAAIDEKSRKISWNLRLAQGVMWDDNINSGPEMDTYNVVSIFGPGILTPPWDAAELKDEASITSAAGNLLLDVGAPKGLMWNTALSFYNKAHFDYSQFNFLSADISTGPWWVGKRDIFKIPFGYTEREYGSDRLSYTLHTDPEYEHHFCQYFSLKGLYSYSVENFYFTGRSGLDNDRYRFELSPTFYFDNRKHVLSITAGYDDLDADEDKHSYDGPYISLSYFTRFPTNTELFLQYQWAKKDFEDKPSLYNNLYREDERNGMTAVVSQGFLKYFYASFAFTYTDNNSNADLFDYRRTTYTLSLGCRF
jgi:tetratricopeptide (TPR) repeat protein